MKQKQPSLLIGLLALAAGCACAPATALTSGTVTFEGELLDVTCLAVVDDRDKSVQLPTISASVLRVSGNTAGSTPFTINVRCPLTARKVRAYFENSAYSDSTTGNLTLMPQQGQTNATNVQVRLLRVDGTPIAVGNGLSMPYFPVDRSGAAKLDYQAVYYATGEAVQGIVYTTATYTLEML